MTDSLSGHFLHICHTKRQVPAQPAGRGRGWINRVLYRDLNKCIDQQLLLLVSLNVKTWITLQKIKIKNQLSTWVIWRDTPEVSLFKRRTAQRSMSVRTDQFEPRRHETRSVFGRSEQIMKSVDLICDLACTVGAGECGCGLGVFGNMEVGVWEMGSRRREVYRQGPIEGTPAFILIRTNLDKLAMTVNTWTPPSSSAINRKKKKNCLKNRWGVCVCLLYRDVM